MIEENFLSLIYLGMTFGIALIALIATMFIGEKDYTYTCTHGSSHSTLKRNDTAES